MHCYLQEIAYLTNVAQIYLAYMRAKPFDRRRYGMSIIENCSHCFEMNIDPWSRNGSIDNHALVMLCITFNEKLSLTRVTPHYATREMWVCILHEGFSHIVTYFLYILKRSVWVTCFTSFSLAFWFCIWFPFIFLKGCWDSVIPLTIIKWNYLHALSGICNTTKLLVDSESAKSCVLIFWTAHCKMAKSPQNIGTGDQHVIQAFVAYALKMLCPCKTTEWHFHM